MKRLVVRLELVDAVLVGFAARVDRCDLRLNSVVHVFSFPRYQIGTKALSVHFAVVPASPIQTFVSPPCV